MKVTAEISLYPLFNEYEGPIIEFINVLKNNDNISVLTHSMSTYVKGEIEEVMMAITKAMKSIGELPASLVIKLISRDLPVESGFLEF